MDKTQLINAASLLFESLETLPIDEKISAINHIRLRLRNYSPFKNEPIDCIQWVANSLVIANDYNPNSVAPPEMALLELSILEDGYTQPVVAFKRDNIFEVVDGFHRTRVAKECKTIKQRLFNYVPVVIINQDRTDVTDRMASTVRHNRARGKHAVSAMAEMVVELKRRNRSNEWIAKHLGMDTDEILRLCQITGLTELFADTDFNRSWEADFSSGDDDKAVNDGDSDKTGRIFHTWNKWECFKCGFFESELTDLDKDEGLRRYSAFLTDLNKFETGLQQVILKWKFSCEHNLTNTRMNRIAWLGQAAACLIEGLPSCYKGGYTNLAPDSKRKADELAFKYLNLWLINNGRPECISLELAGVNQKAWLY